MRIAAIDIGEEDYARKWGVTVTVVGFDLFVGYRWRHWIGVSFGWAQWGPLPSWTGTSTMLGIDGSWLRKAVIGETFWRMVVRRLSGSAA